MIPNKLAKIIILILVQYSEHLYYEYDQEDYQNKIIIK